MLVFNELGGPPSTKGDLNPIIPVLHPIQRTDHATACHLQNMGVDHGGFDVRVAEQLLYAADVIAGLQQVGRKGVTQRVRRGWLDDARRFNRALEIALEGLIVKMMPSAYAGARVS